MQKSAKGRVEEPAEKERKNYTVRSSHMFITIAINIGPIYFPNPCFWSFLQHLH